MERCGTRARAARRLETLDTGKLMTWVPWAMGKGGGPIRPTRAVRCSTYLIGCVVSVLAPWRLSISYGHIAHRPHWRPADGKRRAGAARAPRPDRFNDSCMPLRYEAYIWCLCPEPQHQLTTRVVPLATNVLRLGYIQKCTANCSAID
eukprot:scaffold101251_cov39-Tisochrysis_lutea.AAC.1